MVDNEHELKAYCGTYNKEILTNERRNNKN